METRANYILVGIVTMAVLLASFGFVYWISRGAGASNAVPLEIRIPGSVTGLIVGSQILFNGIPVGAVRGLRIDDDNPGAVIVTAAVGDKTPVTPKTKASLGFQGLTGQAYIELKGGDATERNILEAAAEAGVTARIEADPDAVNNLIDKAQEISARADRILISLEKFVDDNQQPMTRTIANAQDFSDALAKNSEKIDAFMVSVGDMSATLKTVSLKLDSTLTSAEDLLRSVDRKKVDTILANAEKVSGDLAKSSDQIEKLVAGVETSLDSFGKFAASASKTIEGADQLLASVDRTKITSAIDNIEAASKTARTALDDISKVSGKIGARGEDIDAIVANVKSLSTRLNDASTGIESSLANFGKFSESASKTFAKAEGLLDAVDKETVASAVKNVEAASKTARTALDDIATVSGKIGARGDDIDSIVGNVKELTARLNQTSVRVDGVLAKVDGFLGDGGIGGKGLAEEARATLVAFRKVADTLNSRLGEITDGLAKFSGRGLSDVQSAVQESRRSIARIESAITNLERNPQRLIFGGTDSVPRSNGRNRR